MSRNFNTHDDGDPSDAELIAAARSTLGESFDIGFGWATHDGVTGLYFMKVSAKDSEKWYTPIRSETRAGLMAEIHKATSLPVFKHGSQSFKGN